MIQTAEYLSKYFSGIKLFRGCLIQRAREFRFPSGEGGKSDYYYSDYLVRLVTRLTTASISA